MQFNAVQMKGMAKKLRRQADTFDKAAYLMSKLEKSGFAGKKRKYAKRVVAKKPK